MMKAKTRWTHPALSSLLLLLGLGSAVPSARAQTCFTSDDMDAVTRSALTDTGQRYFALVAGGNTSGLQQNSIPSLASSFSGIEGAIRENQALLTGGQAAPRPPYLLKADKPTDSQSAEFLCGLFSANGQTANSAEFTLPNLPAGSYGIVILDVAGSAGPSTVSFVLEQQGSQWKMGGLYIKGKQIAGHDGNWFLERARAFKAKGQTHNAWLYYLQARELLVPLPFMYTQVTDKLYQEAQTVKPSDLPVDGPVALVAEGKTYNLTTVFPLAVEKDLDVVVKYQVASVSDRNQTFASNMAVMKALVAKLPELRDAFNGVVARAVEPSGQDYGSLLAMKDIK